MASAAEVLKVADSYLDRQRRDGPRGGSATTDVDVRQLQPTATRQPTWRRQRLGRRRQPRRLPRRPPRIWSSGTTSSGSSSAGAASTAISSGAASSGLSLAGAVASAAEVLEAVASSGPKRRRWRPRHSLRRPLCPRLPSAPTDGDAAAHMGNKRGNDLHSARNGNTRPRFRRDNSSPSWGASNQTELRALVPRKLESDVSS
uniref:Uncharacterized protein n=1 Tax=Oryza sativa subsp. japonica TaxID=39947 RepID=Q109S7_ORYSJ|nr:hypothetical protein LOC_Os10g22362 [Oryza sativa Japonica Group]